MTKRAQAAADAYPRKRFFLEMFTRDISLEDCLLDLIDNAIDSLMKVSKQNVIATLLDRNAPSGKEPLPEVAVVAKPTEVSVSDNCGGIPKEEALHDVFCFGYAKGHGGGQLGVYGIGLKRAIFKIGNAFEMESQTVKDGFEAALDVNKWAEKDDKLEDWSIPIQITMGSGSPKTAGTRIRFTDLREEVKMRLRDGSLLASLQRSVAEAYAFFLERHVRVTLNGQPIKPMPVPIGESEEISPARAKVRSDGVTMRFFASLIAPKTEWKHERAGWYVLCNGRVVIAANKTDVTGWGALKMPTFHTKYNGFIGIALLESADPLKLPWTTTKRGLNRESPIYQEALREMVSISKPILTFLSKMYPSEFEESPVERELVKRVERADLTDVASKSDAPFQSKPGKASKSTVKVQYDAEKSELEQIKKHLRDPKIGASKIGRLTFDYYLKVECTK